MTTTREEWRVTGDPGYGYPPYEFVFGGPYTQSDDPEKEARHFIEGCKDWINGPHLEHRTVTETEWRDVK